MLFFASGQGRLTVVPAQINQNSNGANTIYLTGAFPSASVVTVAFTLPDGTNTEPQLMTGDKTVDYNGLTLAVKEFSLPKSITQVYGRVTAQFYIQNGSEILATEATNITVAKGVPSESPSAPENIYEQIAAALSSIQAELENPKRETYIGTSVPTDDYPDLFVNTTDDSLSYKAPDGSWKPLAAYAKTTDLAAYAKTVDVVEKSQVGAASGVASLGADGKVPAAQLPTIDNYSKFSEVKLQNSNIVPTYGATTGITVTSTGSMKHANNVVDTPTNTMKVPITAGKNMGATLSGNLVVFTANDQVGVGATLPAGSDSEKIFINTAGNTAKVYYNDNGTWKVVDVQGGGGSGSIDADTLKGLLSADAGISIEKTTAGDKVEVKIDPGADIVGATFEARSSPTSPVEYTTLRYSGAFEYHNPIFDGTFRLPTTGDSGFYQLLASNYVKTLFGNQSIVGSGNIDLYQHNISFTSTDQDNIVKFRFIVISSKNFIVTSLRDLKALLGDTFTYPVNGGAVGNKSVYEITEMGYKAGATPYILYDTVTTYPAGTWTDTVTTI